MLRLERQRVGDVTELEIEVDQRHPAGARSGQPDGEVRAEERLADAALGGDQRDHPSPGGGHAGLGDQVVPPAGGALHHPLEHVSGLVLVCVGRHHGAHPGVERLLPHGGGGIGDENRGDLGTLVLDDGRQLEGDVEGEPWAEADDGRCLGRQVFDGLQRDRCTSGRTATGKR